MKLKMSNNNLPKVLSGKKSFKLGLKSKVLIFVIALLLISYTLVLAMGYMSAKSILINISQEKLELKNQYMVSMLDNFFIPKELLLTTSSDKLHNLIIEKNLKEVPDADVASATFSNWEDIKQSQSALDLYFGRADGTVAAVSGWKPEDKNWKANEQSWYVSAVRYPERVVYTNIHTDEGTQQAAITLAKAVENADNEVIGVLAINIGLTELNNLFSSEKVGETGYSSILDGDGRFVIDPEYTFNDDSDQADKIQTIDNGALSSVFDEMLSNSPMQITAELNGQQWEYYSFHHLIYGLYVVTCITESEFTQPLHNLIFNIGPIVIAAIILFVLFLVLFFNGIIKVIKKVANHMGSIANGDLSITINNIKRKDELGVLNNAIQQMKDKTSQSILNVRQSVDVVTNSSGQLASSAEQMSKGIESVVEAVSSVSVETKSTIDEIHKAVPEVQKIGATIKDTSDIVDKAVGLTDHSIQFILDTSETTGANIEKIVNLTEESSNGVARIAEELIKSNNEIQKLTSLVTNIANQSSLLSLNAQIEAAKAGENGKSFNVVAEEMRKLSESTKHAATEISAVVTDATTRISELETASAKQKDSLNLVKGEADTINVAFKDISNSMQTIKNIISDILSRVSALGSQEENLEKFIETISLFTDRTLEEMMAISASIEQQSATTQEISASAENLSASAMETKEAIDIFKVGV